MMLVKVFSYGIRLKTLTFSWLTLLVSKTYLVFENQEESFYLNKPYCLPFISNAVSLFKPNGVY